MAIIHEKGGIIIPLESNEEAEKIAKSITSDAEVGNHKLICRAINA